MNRFREVRKKVFGKNRKTQVYRAKSLISLLLACLLVVPWGVIVQTDEVSASEVSNIVHALNRQTWVDTGATNQPEDYVNYSNGRYIFADEINGVPDVFVLDEATGTVNQLSNDMAYERSVQISPNYAAYIKDVIGGPQSVYLYNLNTGSEFFIDSRNEDTADWSYIALSDRYLVYTKREGTTRNLYQYNISSGQIQKLTNVISAVRPRISGNYLVYAVNDMAGGPFTVWMMDLNTLETKPISPEGYNRPCISGDNVVFYNRNDFSVNLYKISTNELIPMPQVNSVPEIYHERVVWVDRVSNNLNEYNLITGQLSTVASTTTAKADFAVSSGNRIWLDKDNGQWQIYSNHDAPTLKVDLPTDGMVTDVDIITVSGSASLRNVTINGSIVPVNPQTFNFSHDVILQPGQNTITVEALGTLQTIVTLNVTYQAPEPPTGETADVLRVLNRQTWIDSGAAYQPEEYVNANTGRYIFTDEVNGMPDIFVMERNTGAIRQLTNNPAYERSPQLSRNYAAWIDDRDGQQAVYLYELNTGAERFIDYRGENSTDWPYIAMSDQYVVYSKREGTVRNLYQYNIYNGSIQQLTNVSNAVYPEINGRNLVYSTNEPGGASSVWLMDIYTKLTKQISPENCSRPSIQGDHVVFYDRLAVKAYLYKISTGILTELPEINGPTKIAFDRIVWVDKVTNYIKELSLITGQISIVSATSNPKADFGNSGMNRIWVAKDNGQWKIYGKIADPFLVVDSPIDGLVTNSNMVMVSGTAGWSNVTINGNRVPVNQQTFRFNQMISLQPGQNTITIEIVTSITKKTTTVNVISQGTGPVPEDTTVNGAIGTAPDGTPLALRSIPITIETVIDDPAVSSVSLEVSDANGVVYTTEMDQVIQTWTESFVPYDHNLIVSPLAIRIIPHRNDGTVASKKEFIIILIDPSGYVYNAAKGADWRLPGAIVTLQYFDPMIGWVDANSLVYPGRISPAEMTQETDMAGRYAWDVAEGSYRVVVNRAGFAPTISYDVYIPPEVTNLNVGLTPTDFIQPTAAINGVSDGAYYGEPVSVGINAADDESGVKDVSYNLDGSGVQSAGNDSAMIYVSTSGLHTLDYRITDYAGNETQGSIEFVIDQQAPVLSLNGANPLNIEVGEAYLEPGASATDDIEGDISSRIIIDGTVDTARLGNYLITYNVSDSSNNQAQEITRLVTVVDTTPPEMTLLGPSQITLDVGAPFIDPGVSAVDNNDGDISSAVIVDGSVDTSKTGTCIITYNVKDSSGNSAVELTRSIIVVNNSPVITNISAPFDPTLIDSPVNVTADFSDQDIHNVHTAVWYWGDGSTADGIVSETDGAGTISGSHTYTVSGVYPVKLVLSDNGGGTAEYVFKYVVVYDPNSGFVTGGGWFNSPAGAYTPDPGIAGKANFGFVSKYGKGTIIPQGSTQFQLQMANFNFVSTSYDWLVIAGTKAQFKGTGTVNGRENYAFMLTAVDGNIGGIFDKFRIKIWDKLTGTIIYDNQIGAEDTEVPSIFIGGGSIVIHK